MSVSLLILTIILYILGLVAAVILAFAMKNRPADSIRFPVIAHFIFLLIYAMMAISGVAPFRSYIVLAAFVIALAVSGWSLRSQGLHFILRIYFGLYLLSVPLFIISPSRLFFIITGNYDLYKPEKEFRLESNYYLVEQQSLFQGSADTIHYKLIRKYGLFHKTLGRDLVLPGNLKDAKLIHPLPDSTVIRAYLMENDSIDIGIRKADSGNEITKKIQR